MADKQHFEYRREGRIAFVDFKLIPCRAVSLEAMHHLFSNCCDEIESDDEICVCLIKCMGQDACGTFETRNDFRQWEKSIAFAPSIVESVARLTLPVILAMDG